jgi:hypothetical protein
MTSFMLAGFNPHQHYWLADDGRVFSGPQEQIVDTTDQGYVDFIAEPSNVASIWPRDSGNNQTDATLQAILEPLGMFVNLNYYCIFVRWSVEQNGLTLSSGMAIKTDDRSQAKINGVRGRSVDDPSFTTQWWAADFTIWSLDATQIQAMHNELQTHIDSMFAISADTLTKIQGGTITTRDEVNSAFGFTPPTAAKLPQSFPAKLRHT